MQNWPLSPTNESPPRAWSTFLRPNAPAPARLLPRCSAKNLACPPPSSPTIQAAFSRRSRACPLFPSSRRCSNWNRRNSRTGLAHPCPRFGVRPVCRAGTGRRPSSGEAGPAGAAAFDSEPFAFPAQNATLRVVTICDVQYGLYFIRRAPSTRMGAGTAVSPTPPTVRRVVAEDRFCRAVSIPPLQTADWTP